MGLEFENLTPDLRDMVRSAAQRQRQRRDDVADALARLDEYASAWDTIDERLSRAEAAANDKFFSAARPLRDDPIPLNAPIPAATPPSRATILATDGSQIFPDRHAAFLYYLINVGGLVYHHGGGRSPEPFTATTLNYPRLDGQLNGGERFTMAGGTVSVRRDLAEIETLAREMWARREALAPRLAVVDQRLLYWPIGAEREEQPALARWRAAMTRIHDSDALLAGYIDNPGKRLVVNTLAVLDIDAPGFDLEALSRPDDWERLRDVDLFELILAPGERSKVFVEVSLRNREFRDDNPDNEICFFYLHPGPGSSHVARVDIPMWVARDSAAVTAVHALVYDQCRIVGNYPYVLTRADEIAVVGQQDQAELNTRIELLMMREGVAGDISGKQLLKNLARAGKTRHGI